MPHLLASTDPLTATPPPGHGPRPLPTCESVAELLGEFAADELPELGRIGVERHLAGCESCRRDAAEYGDVIELARSLAPPCPSRAAEARILAALRAAG
ncbi:zf-HC2 domain-containing protein [bacterium]|nr:zf-HC2 domain-containing protein [bacterium]